jgi:hypothetical protein
MSVNDWRFYCYRDLLKTWPQLEAVFFTDLFDCIVQHDPFPWLAEQNCFVTGAEETIDQGEWLTNILNQAYGPEQWQEHLPCAVPCCAAGLFGGHVKILLPFLDILCGLLTIIHADYPTLNANMAAYQMAVSAGFCGRKVYFGSPLHHPDWRQGERDPAAFFHHHWMPVGQESPIFSDYNEPKGKSTP